MKKRLFILSLSLSALLAGCAGIARNEDASTQVFREVRAAALSIKAIGAVERGQSNTLKIGSGSPSLQSQDTAGRFEIVSINGEKQRAFKLSVTGLCDCTGFRKWTVAPLAYLVDGSGNVISRLDSLGPTVVVLNGTFPYDGVYKLVVVADSTRADAKVGELGVGSGSLILGLIGIPLTAQSTGKVAVAHHTDEK